MAELLDRNFQRNILELAAASYPMPAALAPLNADDRALRVNVAYLDEHGLIQGTYPNNLGRRVAPNGALITARGIDFLANDGGLSAVLGVLVVKLHEDTLKHLVATKIQDSELPETDKQRFIDQLRELPGEATKHLTLKLIDAGLENWNKALPILQTLLAG